MEGEGRRRTVKRMRLIDADALIKTLGIADDCQDCPYQSYNFCGRDNDFVVACEAITEAPAIDAVPVVRCRDCIWYEIVQLKKDGTDDRRYKPSLCVLHNRNFAEDYFCADGERREDETVD